MNLSGTNLQIRGATLLYRKICTLDGIPTYPRQLTHAHALQNTQMKHPLTAPSAVHLKNCVPPGSQHPGLSVGARSTLSPPHRFGFFYVATKITLRNAFVKVVIFTFSHEKFHITQLHGIARDYTSFKQFRQ